MDVTNTLELDLELDAAQQFGKIGSLDVKRTTGNLLKYIACGEVSRIFINNPVAVIGATSFPLHYGTENQQCQKIS